jgi:hypothetical protein
MEGEREDLREAGALGPHASIVADDGRGGEMLAVDLAHQVVINVRLPRHLSKSSPLIYYYFFSFSNYSATFFSLKDFWFKGERYK